MAKTFKEYTTVMRGQIVEVTAEELKFMEDTIIIDVRDPDKFNEAHIPGAINIPKQAVEMKIEDIAGDDDQVVVYCGGGSNSSIVTRNLNEMGYMGVQSLQTGIKGWIKDGYEVE